MFATASRTCHLYFQYTVALAESPIFLAQLQAGSQFLNNYKSILLAASDQTNFRVDTSSWTIKMIFHFHCHTANCTLIVSTTLYVNL